MVKSAKTTEPAHRIVDFLESSIRRVWHYEELCFSAVAVFVNLTASSDAGTCGRKVKQRLNTEGRQLVVFCHGLKLLASDGKQTESRLEGFQGP